MMPVLERVSKAPQPSLFSYEVDTMPKLEKGMAQLDKRHRCQDCGAAFSLPHRLKKHTRIHTGERPQKCLHCSMRFRELTTLKYHIMTHTGEKPYQCSYCDKRFIQRGAQKLHMMTHTGEKPHKCSHCDKAFIASYNLKSHMLTQHGLEQPYKCLYCLKSFMKLSSLKRHKLATHSGKKVYNSKEYNLLEFNKVEDAKNEEDPLYSNTIDHKPIESSDEYRGFPTKDAIKKEKLTSDVEKLYKCPHCCKSFRTSSTLRTHIMTHTGEKPHQCSQCHKRFTQTSGLKVHVMRHHRVVKSHKCPYCPLAFVAPVFLQKHMADHSHKATYEHEQSSPIQIKKEEDTLREDSLGVMSFVPTSEIITQSKIVGDPLKVRVQEQSEVNSNLLTSVVHRPHKCAYCLKGFRQPSGLKVHMQARHGVKNPYTCSHCSESFSAPSYLKVHEMTHTGEKSYSCPHCPIKFKKQSTLEMHILTHTGEESDNVPISSQSASQENTGVKHEAESTMVRSSTAASVLQDKLYRCPVCNRGFSYLCNMKRHETIHTRKTPYKCTHCPRTFRLSYSLKLHIMRHNGDRPHVCSDCGKGFIVRHDLKVHSKRHNKKGEMIRCSSFEQAFCDFSALPRDEERDIQDMHNSSKCETFQQPCIQLNKLNQKGSVEKDLHTHDYVSQTKQTECKSSAPEGETQVLDTDQKRHKCTECCSVFRYQTDLKRHKLNHTGGNLHVCHYCSETFKTSASLKFHQMIHTGEKPYNCSVCNRAFRLSTTLKRHMKIHTGEKPYKCCHCSKTFRLSSTMKRHVMIHTGEKPRKCSYCDERFIQSTSLKWHLRTRHKEGETLRCSKSQKTDKPMASVTTRDLERTDVEEKAKPAHVEEKFNTAKSSGSELPYKCLHCSKTFRQCSTLKSHAMLHTGEKPHECSHCGKGFIYKSSLKYHLRTHHKHSESLKCFESINFESREKAVLSGKHQRELDQAFEELKESNHTGNTKRRHKDKENLIIHETPKSSKNIETVLDQHLTKMDPIDRHVISPCKCSVCGKVLCSIYNLTLHMRSHTGERPHVCSDCGAGFAHSSTLVQHRRIHTGEKPYTCSLCKKSFRTYLTVLGHTRIHAGRKGHLARAWPEGEDLPKKRKQRLLLFSYSKLVRKNAPKRKICPCCGEIIRDSVDLRVHAAIHKADNYPSCKDCVRGFDLPEDLETHIFVCHRSFVIC